jgi:pimeloyl-ACP methyl ester carboxylesterase
VSARDRAVVTADGRGLLLREWGSLDGSPVIAHHGTPSCRLDRPGSEADDGRTGVRVISFDRPGYGGSPPRPGRNVGAAAEDVAAIADALGLDRFAVYGVSGGGPHALACAALLGERVTRVAVSGSVAPADDPELDWFSDMHPLSVPEFRAAMQGRAELEPLVRPYVAALREDPHAASDAWLDGLPASDRRILLDPARRELDAIAEVEANRQAGEGWIDDDLALVRPWGFELESIAVPVRLWHGEADILIPPAHSRRLARRIPAAELVLVPGAGHWLDADHPDMLAWLSAR